MLPNGSYKILYPSGIGLLLKAAQTSPETSEGLQLAEEALKLSSK